MKIPVLIRYNLILFLVSFSLCTRNNSNTSSHKESTPSLKSTEQINIEKQIKYILKGNDSILLYRKSYRINDRHIDSIALKMNSKIHFVSFPELSGFDIKMSKSVPKKKIYNYSKYKFLLEAIYRDIVIQYVYNHKENKLESIYVFINTDEVYPDFNRKPTDTISKIKAIEVNKSVVGISEYLKKISDSISNSFYDPKLDEKIKYKNIYYVLRKDGMNDYFQ
jgi:hypothetical protein